MAEVRRELEELREKSRAGVDLIEVRGREPLGDFLKAWSDAGAERWKPGTLANYRDLIRLHIKPYLIAGKPLESVQPGHVLEWLRELRRAGAGARTRQAAHLLLRTALKAAVRMNLVLYNAAERVEPPRVRSAERVVLDRAHVLALLQAAADHPYEAAIVLAALRRSNFHRRVWVPLRKAAKLPDGCRFHDLRHGAASALIAAGVDVATVSGTLGHSGPHVTMRVYSHALPSRKREAAERVDALYGS